MDNKYDFRRLNNAQRVLLNSLYQQGVLKQFIENAISEHGLCRTLRSPEENKVFGHLLDIPSEYLMKVAMSFSWEDSTEGHEFWINVYDKVEEDLE